jgi:uncharacterized protein (TIGR02145 family)
MAFYYDSQTGAEQLIRKIDSSPVFYAEVILNDRLHKWMVDEEYRDYGSNIRVLKDLTDQIAEIRRSGKTITKPKPKRKTRPKKLPVYKTVKIGNQEYKTVVLGNQEWMAENLKVICYRNGDAIPEIKDNAKWEKIKTGARCAYDNEESNADTYGYLYNWYAVADRRNIAPEGWHVPTDDDWKVLEMHLGMRQSEVDNRLGRGSPVGSKLAGNDSLWPSDELKDHSKFGTSGFSALPGSYRSFNRDGEYPVLGHSANFWSSTKVDSKYAWYRSLHFMALTVYRSDCNKHQGFSIRLLRD